jgi:hypothetical protein
MRIPSLCDAALSLVFTLTLLSNSSFASAQISPDRDTKAYGSYPLTMPKYQKYLTAMVNLAQANSRNPKIGHAMEGFDSLSSDQMVAQLTRVADARRVITSTGLTPRDYVLTQGAVMRAGVAYNTMKELKLSPDSATKAFGVSRANLEFVGKNDAEITRSMNAAEAKVDALEGNGEDKGK